MGPIAAAGFDAGALIAVVTVLAEHSRIGVGSYALFGSGAIIVPALLARSTRNQRTKRRRAPNRHS